MPILKKRTCFFFVPLWFLQLLVVLLKGVSKILQSLGKALRFELRVGEIEEGRGNNKKRRHDMGVSKNNGTPKWMVYNGKPY